MHHKAGATAHPQKGHQGVPTRIQLTRRRGTQQRHHTWRHHGPHIQGGTPGGSMLGQLPFRDQEFSGSESQAHGCLSGDQEFSGPESSAVTRNFKTTHYKDSGRRRSGGTAWPRCTAELAPPETPPLRVRLPPGMVRCASGPGTPQTQNKRVTNT